MFRSLLWEFFSFKNINYYFISNTSIFHKMIHYHLVSILNFRHKTTFPVSDKQQSFIIKAFLPYSLNLHFKVPGYIVLWPPGAPNQQTSLRVTILPAGLRTKALGLLHAREASLWFSSSTPEDLNDRSLRECLNFPVSLAERRAKHCNFQVTVSMGKSYFPQHGWLTYSNQSQLLHSDIQCCYTCPKTASLLLLVPRHFSRTQCKRHFKP